MCCCSCPTGSLSAPKPWRGWLTGHPRSRRLFPECVGVDTNLWVDAQVPWWLSKTQQSQIVPSLTSTFSDADCERTSKYGLVEQHQLKGEGWHSVPGGVLIQWEKGWRVLVCRAILNIHVFLQRLFCFLSKTPKRKKNGL